MAAGYVPTWIPLLEAIQHVQRVVGGTLEDAHDKLLIALREGGVASRYRGEEVGGIAALIEGRGGGVPPARWYRASVYDDGSVEFADDRHYPFPRRLGLPRQQIWVQRSDLLRWWPARPEAATEEPASALGGEEDSGTLPTAPGHVPEPPEPGEAAPAGDSTTVPTGTTAAIEAEEKRRGPRAAHESPDEEPALRETSAADDPPPVDVQGATSDVVDQPAEKQSAPSSRKRGRPPSKFKQVVDMMRQKIANGDLTREQLNEMLEKELERDFGASRDTCRKARYTVLDGP